MSKIRLSGSNSGYVEIAAAADAGNLTFTMPTTGTALFGNGNNVISGITTFSAALDINSTVDVSGTSVFNNDVTFDGATSGYDAVWDRSDNALEFAANAKATFGASQDMQLYHDGNHGYIADAGTGNLRLRSGTLEIQNLAGSKTSAVFSSGGGQTLNFNNNTKFVTTNTGAVVTGICTATSFSGDGSNLTGLNTPLSFRNLIINGAMMVAQRGTSVASTGYKTCDRWQFGGNWPGSAITQEQATVAYNSAPYDKGFRKSYKLTNSNQGSASAGDNIEITYSFEGQEIANSGWDYVNNSKKITLSFWVKSSVAQTFYGYFRTFPGVDMKYSFPIVCSTTGWEFKTVSIVGETNFAENVHNSFPNTTSRAMVLRIVPYYGTTYTDSGAINNAWQNYSSSTITPVYDTSWFLTNGATFELTGVQLEVGDTATPFEHRGFSDELRRCMRYYEGIIMGTGTALFRTWTNTSGSPTNVSNAQYDYKVEKRATPTWSLEGNGTWYPSGTSGMNAYPSTSTCLFQRNDTTHQFLTDGAGDLCGSFSAEL